MSTLVILLLQVILAGCAPEEKGDLVLFDFESDFELDRLEWNCHTMQSLSDAHATHGHRCLKVELYSSEYPGFITPVLTTKDWSGYKELRFDVFNPQEHEVPVVIRIDDRQEFPVYGERYNRNLVLQPGINRMGIPLGTLFTSGSGRRLNLKRISRLIIFLPHPRERTVLYLDYIRLSNGKQEGSEKA